MNMHAVLPNGGSGKPAGESESEEQRSRVIASSLGQVAYVVGIFALMYFLLGYVPSLAAFRFVVAAAMAALLLGLIAVAADSPRRSLGGCVLFLVGVVAYTDAAIATDVERLVINAVPAFFLLVAVVYEGRYVRQCGLSAWATGVVVGTEVTCMLVGPHLLAVFIP